MNNAVLKKSIINAIGIVAAIAIPNILQAASFDCTKASAPIEKLICASPAVSNLDEQLAVAYKFSLEKAADKEALKQQQRTWLKEKRNACKDITCLFTVYQQRLVELNNVSVGVGGNSQNRNGTAATTKPAPKASTIPENKLIENQKLPLTFKLVSGDSYPLCQPYVDMLNKTEYMGYPSCERKLLPEFKQFKAIEWEEITDKMEIEKVLYEALALQEARYDRLNTSMHERAWKLVKEDLDYGNYHLYFYQFDFDKDGDNEIIYKKTLPHPRGPESYRCNVLNIYSVFDKKITIENTVKYSMDGYQMIKSEGQLFVFDGKVINSIWQPIGDESSIELWTSNSRPSLCKINAQ